MFKKKSLKCFIALVCVMIIIAGSINVSISTVKKYKVKASDVKIASSESDFTIVDGVLTKYNGTGGDVTIPDSVTSIGEEAFAQCTSLTSVTIPDSVTNIGKYAFEKCTSLVNVSIPNSVTNMDEGVFCECASLTRVSIPNSVTNIGAGLFYDCNSLTKVSLSKNIKQINSYTFYSCNALTNLTVFGIVSTLPIGKNEKNSIIIPNGINSIGENAFQYCSALTDITISNSVTSIEMGAFSNCTSLTNINIPNSVTSIGSDIFYGCTSFVITGEADSCAIQYAKDNGYNYTIIETETPGITPTVAPTEMPTLTPVVTFTETPTKTPVITSTVIPTETPVVTPTAIITPTPLPNQIDLKEADITLNKQIFYCAYKSTVKPLVTVKYNDIKLTKNQDYTISYTDNKMYGQGKVIVTGIGAYAGVVEETFLILPKKSNISGCKTCIFRKQKVMKLTWKKQKGVEGYQIVYAYSKNGKYKEMSKKYSDITSYVFIIPKKKIYIKIRAYVRVNGKIKYGQYSSIKKAVLK